MLDMVHFSIQCSLCPYKLRAQPAEWNSVRTTATHLLTHNEDLLQSSFTSCLCGEHN